MDKERIKVLRVKLRSLTASFRQIGFITGYQPTLPVPPLSTIYGIISAAKGEFIDTKQTNVGYIFKKELHAEVIIKHKAGHFSAEDNCVTLPDVVDGVLKINN